MASEIGLPGVDFGVLIAHVAPGFVAFTAASYHWDTAKTWMRLATEKEQTVGVFFFVVLASLALGLVVSGVRAILFDRLLRWKLLGPLKVEALKLDWSRVDEHKLTTLLTIRDAFYRYYQFYSNTAVALIVLAAARWRSAGVATSWWVQLLAALTVVALLWSARESYHRYVKGVHELLG